MSEDSATGGPSSRIRLDAPGMPASRIFRSFWHAGFESASHRNGRGVRVDMVAATHHLEQVDDDYARLREVGIRVAREGVRWPLVERAGRFDVSSLEPILAAARRHGIQVIWTLCHYGWPDDLDVFAPEFVPRFATYCAAAMRCISRADETPFVIPMNEISFLAFAAGEVGWFHPFARGRGDELKAQLVQATIAGIEAIWRVDARARIVHVDPLINVIAPGDRPDLEAGAAAATASQFAAWDWLSGRARPELGGHPRYLDIIGVNFYPSNQWDTEGVHLAWDAAPRDPRWIPLHTLLDRTYRRYRRPFFLAETSHSGAGRGPWIREVATEVALARVSGVPVDGICLYPILDRPDWHDPAIWHQSGLWALVPDAAGHLQRSLIEEYAAALVDASRIIGRHVRKDARECDR